MCLNKQDDVDTLPDMKQAAGHHQQQQSSKQETTKPRVTAMSTQIPCVEDSIQYTDPDRLFTEEEWQHINVCM